MFDNIVLFLSQALIALSVSIISIRITSWWSRRNEKFDVHKILTKEISCLNYNVNNNLIKLEELTKTVNFNDPNTFEKIKNNMNANLFSLSGEIYDGVLNNILSTGKIFLLNEKERDAVWDLFKLIQIFNNDMIELKNNTKERETKK